MNVTIFSIKNGYNVIPLNAWRDAVDLPETLEIVFFFMFQAVKKITEKGGTINNIELRYKSLTEQKTCPDELHDELVIMTHDNMDGATLWTQNLGALRDFTI